MPLRLAESHRWKREEESGRSSGVMTPVMTVSAHELRLSRLQFFSRFFWFLDGDQLQLQLQGRQPRSPIARRTYLHGISIKCFI